MDWIREHPYLAGTLAVFVVVLFLVFRARSSASTSQQVAVASGPSDALQAASLQAQVQQQGIQAAADVSSQQTGAALAAHLADVQASLAQTSAARDVGLQAILTQGSTADYTAAAGLQAVEAQTGAAVNIADTQAGAGVQVAAIQGSTAVQLAGIQAPVYQAQIAAALAATENTNATSLGIAGIQGAVTISGQQTSLAASQDANATAAKINEQNVGGAVQVAEIQAGTQNLAITTAGDVSSHLIASQQEIASEQNTTYGNIWDQFFANLSAGTFNKGGSGGANQVSVVGAFTGQPSVGAPAQAAQAASQNAWSSFWNGLFGAGAKVATAAIP